MQTEIITMNHVKAAVIYSGECILRDSQSALDFIMSMKYETGCERIALNKKAIAEEFFILSTGLAGEILQKFINYGIKFAVYGDFSRYTSKPLKDFIYESNHGTDVFFTSDREEAVKRLTGYGKPREARSIGLPLPERLRQPHDPEYPG